MADESNSFVKNEAEEANISTTEDDNKKSAEVIEGESEQSEEESLVYDRSHEETSESDTEHIISPANNGGSSNVAAHEQEEEGKGKEEQIQKSEEVEHGVKHDEEDEQEQHEEEDESEESGDDEQDGGDGHEEWKEDKQITKVTKDPAMVPRDCRYFLHDDRYDVREEEDADGGMAPMEGRRGNEEKEESEADLVERWTHDLYVEEQQGPRTEEEKDRDQSYYRRRSDHREGGRRPRGGGYDNKRRSSDEGWKGSDFPTLDENRDSKRQLYHGPDGNRGEKQIENKDQWNQTGNQQYRNKAQQYRSRDQNRNRWHQGGNQQFENRDWRYGNRDQRYKSRNQDQHYYGRSQFESKDQNRDQQYGNRDGNRGRWYQGEDNQHEHKDQIYQSRTRDKDRQDRSKGLQYQNRDSQHENRDQQHRNREWRFEDSESSDWGNDQQDQRQPNNKTATEQRQPNNKTATEQRQPNNKTATEQRQPNNKTATEQRQPNNKTATDQRQPDNKTATDKISSYNFNLKATTAADAVKVTSPRRASSGTKLLFGKPQTSSHPTRVFSLKKGRGAGQQGSGSGAGKQGSGSGLLSGDTVGRGRGRGRGTKPIVVVAPPIIGNASNSEVSCTATPTITAQEEIVATGSGSEVVSSSQEVTDEQFDDATPDNDVITDDVISDDVTTESKKESAKPKRYSSQRQKPGEAEMDNKQSSNRLPLTTTAAGAGVPKVGLLPTPNFDQSLATVAQQMMGVSPQPSLVQQMLLAQQQAAAQYVNMLHQQHVMSAGEVMMENQSNVVVPPPIAPTGNPEQRELGPFHWMAPTLAFPGFGPAGLYGNLHMQQLFQPAAIHHQQALAPPPQPEGEVSMPGHGGLFIPPLAPDQQRLMQKQLATASYKHSQAVRIVDPKLSDTEP